MKVINIGILAHIDAGKTTLAENILFESGVINHLGRVDKANAVTDNLKMERDRGITIKETTVSFIYKGVKFNLLDTPGHADFISEVTRALQVLDVAILVISAKEGIQTQTIVLYNQLMKLKVPTIIFINKVDRVGANVSKVCDDIQNIFNKKYILMDKIKEAVEDSYKLINWDEDIELIENNLLKLSEYEEKLIEQYDIDENTITSYLR
ncbi:MAG: GTP-binding protein, partial [Clostridiaceae bacterium]|nr:GTP-binding protein [Clostridiaceae bacterium]